LFLEDDRHTLPYVVLLFPTVTVLLAAFVAEASFHSLKVNIDHIYIMVDVPEWR
jgi:hypothetical protein